MPRQKLIVLLLCLGSVAAAAPPAPRAAPATTPTASTRRSPTTLHVGQRVNRDVHLAPGGRYAMSFSVDVKRAGEWTRADSTSCRLFNVDDGRDIAAATLKLIQPHFAALTPDGRFVVMVGTDQSDAAAAGDAVTMHQVGGSPYCAVWDFRAPAGPRELCRIGDPVRVRGVAVSDDGERLLCVEDDHTPAGGGAATGRVLRLRDARTGRIISQGDAQAIANPGPVAMAAAARLAVTGGREGDETVRVWNLETGRWTELRGHTNVVVAVDITSDGRYAASADRRTIRVWDTATSTAVRELRVQSGEIRAIALSRDGRWLLSAHHLQEYIPSIQAMTEVRLWDVEAGRARTLAPYGVQRGGLAFREPQDGAAGMSTAAVVATHLRTIVTFDLPPSPPARGHADKPLVLRPAAGVASAATSPATQPVVGVARLIHLIRPARVGQRPPFKVGAVAWNDAAGPHGQVVAALQDGPDNLLYRWDVRSGEQVAQVRLVPTDRLPSTVALSADGTRVFSLVHAQGGMTAVVWDAANGSVVATYRGVVNVLHALAVSPDGRIAASGGATYEQKGTSNDVLASDVGLWDAGIGRNIASVKGDGRKISALAFSPDGARLVTGSDEPPVADHIFAPAPAARKLPGLRLWDVKTATEIASHVGPLNVADVAFTRDGKRVVACGQGKGGWDHIWVLDAERLEPIAVARVEHSSLTTLAISPDGTRLITGGGDSNVRVWNLADLRELHRFDEHAAAVRCITFSPDGRRAVSGDDAGGVGIWELPPPSGNP